MTEQPPREQQIHLEGPYGETLVSRPVAFVLKPTDRDTLQTRIDHLLSHVVDLKDDRLLAITGALILENALDGLLEAYLPRFSLISEGRDFSFGVRTTIAKALDVVPRKLFLAVDSIRQIRNDFGHNLELQAFTALPRGRMDTVRLRLREFGEQHLEDDPTPFQQVERVISFTTMGFLVYRPHLELLSQATRAPEFADYMKAYAEKIRHP